jgi:hypothetical protein
MRQPSRFFRVDFLATWNVILSEIPSACEGSLSEQLANSNWQLAKNPVFWPFANC